MNDANALLKDIRDFLENISKTQESINDSRTQRVWEQQRYDVTSYDKGNLVTQSGKTLNDLISAMNSLSQKLKDSENTYKQSVDAIIKKGLIKDNTDVDEILDAIKELHSLEGQKESFEKQADKLYGEKIGKLIDTIIEQTTKINELKTKETEAVNKGDLNAGIAFETQRLDIEKERKALIEEKKELDDKLNEFTKKNLDPINKLFHAQQFKVDELTNFKYINGSKDDKKALDDLLSQKAAFAKTLKEIADATKKNTEAQQKGTQAIIESQEAVRKAKEQWKEIKTDFSNALGHFRSAFGVIKDSTEYWRRQEDAIAKLSNQFGFTTDELGNYRKFILEASVETERLYNISAEGLIKLQQGYAETTSRAVKFNEAQIDAQAQYSKLVGEDNVTEFLSQMDKFGIGITDAIAQMDALYSLAKENGISTTAASKIFVDNLKTAQNYTFSGGLNNLRQMAVYSARMKVNLAEIGNAVDKMSNPEGAIEAAARLQVLGGQFSTLSNPISMLFESMHDFEGLTERITDMFEGLGTFNKITGQVDISGVDRLRIKAAAEALGVSFENAMEMARERVKRNQIKQDVQFQTNLTEDDKELLMTLAQFNKQSGFTVNLWNEDTQKYEETRVAEISHEDIDKLRGDENDMKNIVESTMGINANVSRIWGAMQASRAVVQERLFGDITRGTLKSANNFVGNNSEMVGQIGTWTPVGISLYHVGMGIWGVLTSIAGIISMISANQLKMLLVQTTNSSGGMAAAASKGLWANRVLGVTAGALPGLYLGYDAFQQYKSQKETREQLLESGQLKVGSEADKIYQHEATKNNIGNFTKAGTTLAGGIGGGVIGAKIGAGFGSIGGPVGALIGGGAGALLGIALGYLTGKANTSVYDHFSGVNEPSESSNENREVKVDDALLGKEKIIANPDDSMMFAKSGGPFDKIFSGIIPKIEGLYAMNKAALGINPAISQTSGLSATSSGFASKIEKIYSLNEETNSYAKSIASSSSIDMGKRISNISNFDSIFSDYSQSLESIRSEIENSFAIENNDTPQISVVPAPLGHFPIKVDKSIVSGRESASEGLNKPLSVSPVEVKINGSLKLESDQGKAVDIIGILQKNPVLLKNLSKMISDEVAYSLNGGRLSNRYQSPI